MTTTATTAQDLYADGAVSVEAAALFVGLSRASIYKLMDRGELPYSKLGTRRLIPKRALVELLAANSTTTGG